jgi:cytochrome P450
VGIPEVCLRGAYLNKRGMSLDERVYHDPKAFLPERYLPKSKGGNGEPFFHATFGYGRRSFSVIVFLCTDAYLLSRICPGRYLGYNSVFVALAYLISVFNMEKATTPDGQPITPAFDFCDGLVQ